MAAEPAVIAIATLGCKVNQCDTAAFREALEQRGYRVCAFGEHADAYIINTCVVTAATEAQSRQCIRRALRASATAPVLVTGCYAHRSHADLRALSDRVHVIGNAEKSDLPAHIDRLLAGSVPGVQVSDIMCETAFTTPAFSRFLDRSRAFLKIQDGCNSRCSYCIVPLVRGRSRSLAPGSVLERLGRLVDSGYREIVLTGIHLGAYGRDLDPPLPFVELLKLIENSGRLESVRLRISSIEPTDFSQELIEFLARSRRVCPHLHIPLQSGDDAVLRDMRRPYTAEFFSSLVYRLTGAIADLNLGIDVIAGFPGETDARFTSTEALLAQLPVGYLHVFPYSRRLGTRAALLPGQVPAPVRKERTAVLPRLSDAKKERLYRRYIGHALPVLVENSRDGAGRLKGFSHNYIPLAFEGPEGLSGCEVRVILQKVARARACGTLDDRVSSSAGREGKRAPCCTQP